MADSRKVSSIPGLSYFPSRDEPISTGQGYLEGRRRLDGAENLWRIGDRLYDLENWAASHPGGREWITLTKGTDITELFESHHISNKAERLLPKFFARDAKTKRKTPWTFAADGFYRTFKERALLALRGVDYHKPSTRSNLVADSLVSLTLLSCVVAAKTEAWISILAAGLFLGWTTVCAHNYFHMRDNFRMYYFDLSLMSSKEWRITHVLSHHMYPNTIWDFEIYTFEPFVQWLPRPDKPFVPRFFAPLYSPLAWTLLFYVQGLGRYCSVVLKRTPIELRDFVPFLVPLAMYLVSWSLVVTIKTWLLVVATGSLLFSFVGVNAAHHHPRIFHDGDIYRDNLDWGLLELDAVRDRRVVDDVPFLVLTNFGSHSLHHLLPTLDHGYLPLCREAFEKTCQEFRVGLDKFTQWELIKGQFQQLCRVQPRKNAR